MMQLELEIFNALCSTSKFVINGIVADKSDFGEQWDNDSESAEDYACGDMKFEGKDANQTVLDKYGINDAEYLIIVGQLEVGLSFGRCGWCV